MNVNKNYPNPVFETGLIIPLKDRKFGEFSHTGDVNGGGIDHRRQQRYGV
jgi:hypothetical protein